MFLAYSCVECRYLCEWLFKIFLCFFYNLLSTRLLFLLSSMIIVFFRCVFFSSIFLFISYNLQTCKVQSKIEALKYGIVNTIKTCFSCPRIVSHIFQYILELGKLSLLFIRIIYFMQLHRIDTTHFLQMMWEIWKVLIITVSLSRFFIQLDFAQAVQK